MDANGTRFHLLIGKADWSRCRSAADDSATLAVDFARAPVACGSAGDPGGFAWEDSTQALTLRPCLVQFKAPAKDTPPDPTGAGRRGAACDRYGNIYWIADSSAEITIVPAATGRAVHFWSPGDGLTRAADRRYGEFHPAADAPPPPALRLA